MLFDYVALAYMGTYYLIYCYSYFWQVWGSPATQALAQSNLQDFFFRNKGSLALEDLDMLSAYINRIMILMIVDVGVVLAKGYWGTQTILAHRY